MKKQDNREPEIIALEKYLRVIRQSFGWTAEELAKQIGVVRQTISSIETGTGKLNLTEYLAIRLRFEQEIEKHPDDTQMAKALLDAFVDNPNDMDKYSEEARKEMLKNAKHMAPSIVIANESRKEVSKNWETIVGIIAGLSAATIAGIAIALWRKK